MLSFCRTLDCRQRLIRTHTLFIVFRNSNELPPELQSSFAPNEPAPVLPGELGLLYLIWAH